MKKFFESGWTRQIPTFGEFNFYRPEGGEFAKKSASSSLDEVYDELAKNKQVQLFPIWQQWIRQKISEFTIY